MPRDWVHFADHRIEVPHDACYWACCGGKYVWIGQEEMVHLSSLVLVLQKIARADLASAYFPRVQNTKIEKQFGFPDGRGPVDAKVTFYVDQFGCLTSAADAPALPRKKRFDNVGTDSDLKSVINASAKSAQ